MAEHVFETTETREEFLRGLEREDTPPGYLDFSEEYLRAWTPSHWHQAMIVHNIQHQINFNDEYWFEWHPSSGIKQYPLCDGEPCFTLDTLEGLAENGAVLMTALKKLTGPVELDPFTWKEVS